MANCERLLIYLDQVEVVELTKSDFPLLGNLVFKGDADDVTAVASTQGQVVRDSDRERAWPKDEPGLTDEVDLVDWRWDPPLRGLEKTGSGNLMTVVGTLKAHDGQWKATVSVIRDCGREHGEEPPTESGASDSAGGG